MKFAALFLSATFTTLGFAQQIEDSPHRKPHTEDATVGYVANPAKALLNPNWKAVEDRLGVPIPAELKAFYADPRKVLQENFDLETITAIEGDHRVHVENFSTIGDPREGPIPGNERFLAFASDGGGGAYQFDPKESNPEIIYYFVDGDDRFPTGLTLSQFLNAPRLKPEE